MRRVKKIICLSLACLAAPAAAWDEMSDAETCVIADTWELGHSVFIMKSIDKPDDDIMSDHVFISIYNDDWSIKADDAATFELKFEGNDGAWLSGSPISVNHGLLMKTEIKYLNNFNFLSTVSVLKGKEKIATLDWGGFFAGMLAFERCINKAREPIIERRRRESVRKATPKDPFAKPAN